MKFTGIHHSDKGNYQLDYFGDSALKYFEEYCIGSEILWARLFYESDGDPIAKYVKGNDLIML